MSQYSEDRAALATVFPRGRFTRDEEGACVLTARRAARAQDFVYVQDPGRKLGIFYVGRGQVYRNALQDLIVGEVEADGEGLIFTKWVPEVAERLPWFSRRKGHPPKTPFLRAGTHEEGTSSASAEVNGQMTEPTRFGN